MSDLLSDILENSGGAVVISQDHNLDNINVQAALMDENELRKMYSAEQIQAMRNDPTKMREAKEAAIQRANLNVKDGKVSVAFSKTGGWHGLGTVLDRNMTRQEALFHGGADFKVEKYAVSYRYKGEWITSEGDYLFVRSDTGQALGRVGSKSEPIQNEAGSEVVDYVLGQGNGHYSSAGVLGNGEKVWLCGDFPESRFEVVPNDTIETKLIAMIRHDGKGTTRFYPYTNRPECENTLNVSLTSASAHKKGIRIRHSGDIAQKMRAAEKTLLVSLAAYEQFKERAQFLVTKPIDSVLHYANDVLDAALGITIESLQKESDLLSKAVNLTQIEIDLKQKTIEKKLRSRVNILEEILHNANSESCIKNGIANTGWGVFNAVTQYADHGLKYRGEKAEENRFESNLYGKSDEMKQIALEKILAY